MTNTASRARKRIVFLALVPLGLGGGVGLVLSSLGLLPKPTVAVEWTSPLTSIGAYVPTGHPGLGDQIVLVYIGSSTCPWANHPEFPGLVRAMKTELQAWARRHGRAFGTVAIARDRVAADGIRHLGAFGGFDEVLAGNGWANTGIQRFLYGVADLGGPSATPQVVLLSRRIARRAGRVSIEDERVLVRKTGLQSILDWEADGLPVPTEEGEEAPPSDRYRGVDKRPGQADSRYQGDYRTDGQDTPPMQITQGTEALTIPRRLHPTLAIAAILVAAPAASAQATVTVWGGANIANMFYTSEIRNDVPDGESVTGVAVGAAVAIPVAGPLALQLSGAYVRKGTSFSFVWEGLDAREALEIGYYEFGAFGRVDLGSSLRVSAHLLAGLSTARESSCNNSGRLGTGSPTVTSCDLNPTITLSDLDLGASAGGGLAVRLNDRVGVEVGALYTHGLRDLHEADNEEVRHRALTLRSGLSYVIN